MLVLIWIMFYKDFDMVKVYLKVQILKKPLSNTTFSLATETFLSFLTFHGNMEQLAQLCMLFLKFIII